MKTNSISSDKKLIEKCCILVVSCDLYKEAWLPFFSLLKKQWNPIPFDVFLVNEKETFSFEGINVINSNIESWTKKISYALNHLKYDFYIIMLEDFFLQKKVNEDKIFEALVYLNSEKENGVFYFNRISKYTTSSKYADYFSMEFGDRKDGLYMCNCQAAIWKREVLDICTKIDFSPWEFENKGYQSFLPEIKKYKFFCYKYSWYDEIRDNDIFPYILVRDKGFGIWKSKWLWNNERLFKKYNIKFKPKKLKKISRFRFKINYYFERIKRKNK